MDPPPAPRDIQLTKADGGCPEAFEYCVTGEQATVLYLSVTDLRSSLEEAWRRCGPPGGAKDY